jgi:hypothetical protein|tara:strand:- start:2883 stop:3083 length:201 start_codon:yes stop_codon:yes gene_type:complete
MTKTNQNQGIFANHARLLAAIEAAKAMASICGAEALGQGDTSLYSVYADLGAAIDVSSRRASQIKI